MSGRETYSFARVILRLMPLYFKSSPKAVIANIFAHILTGLMVTAVVVVTQNFFDRVVLAASGELGFVDLIPPLLVLAAITLGQQIIEFVDIFLFYGVIHLLNAGELRMLMHNKLQRVNPVLFEDTRFLDDINKAREGIDETSRICYNLICMVTGSFVYLLSLGIYLFQLHPWLLFILLLSFVPAMLSLIIRARVFTNLEEESAPLRREYEYYQRTLTDRAFFKETRILGAFKFFHKLFMDTMHLFTQKQWQAERKMALMELALNLFAFGGMAAAVWLLFTATMAGDISVGAFAAVLAALSTIFGFMYGIIVWQLGRINQAIGKAANLD